MTIITKPITEKKKLEQPLVINESEQDVESAVVPPLYVYRKRPSTWMLYLASILLLTIGLVGSAFLYQVVNPVPSRQFRGWCHIPYEPAEAYIATRENMMFNEEFDIDLENNYASIRVPDFSGGRSGRFIHDFNANMTGIIDIDGDRCFVMPLNREVVLPPKNMIDLVMKLWNGYYEVDTRRIREHMRVVFPPVSDLAPLGSFISKECAGKPVYLLAKESKILLKRSADSNTEFFAEFAGHNTQQVDVVNLAAVEDYERQQQAVANAAA